MTETPTTILAPSSKPHALCGFCATGSHEKCPVAVRNGDGTPYACGCPGTVEMREHPRVRCVDCGNRREDEVSLGFTCVDQEACRNEREQRTAATLRTMFNVDDNTPASVIAKVASIKEEPKVTPPRKLGTGSCLCCDVPTRGGNFAPGHDTRYVSILVHDVLTGAADREVVRAQLDSMPKLQAKFDKRLDLNEAMPQDKRAVFIAAWGELAAARRAKRAEANPTGRSGTHAATDPVAYKEIGA